MNNHTQTIYLLSWVILVLSLLTIGGGIYEMKITTGAIQKFEACCQGKEIELKSGVDPEEFTEFLSELNHNSLTRLMEKSNSEILFGAVLAILAVALLITVRKCKSDF